MGKIKKEVMIKEVLQFSDKEIKENAKEIMAFLKKIYPSLVGEGYKEGRFEIRFLQRTDDTTRKNPTIPLWSFSSWKLDEETEELLYKKLKERNGLACCVYFSGYTFDYSKLNEKGKKPNKINNENSIYTEILPADFDNVTEEQFLLQKQIFESVGIETYDVFSGHGFQTFVLLNEKCYDKNIYEQYTNLLLSLELDVDSKIKDSARILRLTNTYNCKEFLIGDKNYNEIDPKGISTYVYNKTDKRYSVKEVFGKLESLLKNDFEEITALFDQISTKSNFKSEEIQEEAKEEKPTEKPQNKPNKEDIKAKVFTSPKEETPNVELKNLKDMYIHLDYEKQPLFVQNMLKGTPSSGVGNDSLMFIIPYLRNTLNLSVKKQIETLKIWGKLCKPVWSEEEIKSEVTRLNKYNNNAVHGNITPELIAAFGAPELDKWERKHQIIIPNEVFEKLKIISDGAFRIYLGIKLLEHQTKKVNFNIDEICKIVGVTDRTFKKHIAYLTKNKIVTKKKANRVKGEKYEYYTNPYWNEMKGFTKVEASLIRLILKEGFTGAEPSFYLYLIYMGDCYASQTYLAEKLGKKDHTAISKLTDNLHEKGYIFKETKLEGKVLHSTYTLLL